MKLTDIVLESVRFGAKEKKIVDKMANDIRIGFEFEWHIANGIRQNVGSITNDIYDSFVEYIKDNAILEGIENLYEAYKLEFELAKAETTEDAEEIIDEIIDLLDIPSSIEDNDYKTLIDVFDLDLPTGDDIRYLLEVLGDFTDLTDEEELEELNSKLEDFGLVNYSIKKAFDELKKATTTSKNRIWDKIHDEVSTSIDELSNGYYITDDLESISYMVNVEPMEYFAYIVPDNDAKYEIAEEMMANTNIDGTIKPEKDDITEVSTVPYNFRESLSVLKRALEWLKYNIEEPTSEYTGLHINLSIRNTRFNRNNLNPIKLIAMLPERFIKKNFGPREYVYSNLEKMLENTISSDFWYGILEARDRKIDPAVYLDEYLNNAIEVTKYRFINFQHLTDVYDMDTNRIEFRFPGGKGYENRYDEIVQFMYMMAYMTVIAYTDKAGQKEYMKELNRIIDWFSMKEFDMSFGALYKYWKKHGDLP